MARFSEEPRQFLLDVQNFLETGPQAAQEELSHIASWLSKLDLEEMDESHQSNVKVVQLLGTAVGKQWEEHRMVLPSHMILWQINNNGRCMAGPIPRIRDPDSNSTKSRLFS